MIYPIKQPGDVLYLPASLGKKLPGYFVLLSVGKFCGLAHAGVNEHGRFCVTNHHVTIAMADLGFFLPTGTEVLPFEG